jgi:hypothetical protein
VASLRQLARQNRGLNQARSVPTTPRGPYLWQGFSGGSAFGLVQASDGSILQGRVNGNVQPALNSPVSFTPGELMGDIAVGVVIDPAPTVAPQVAGGGAGIVFDHGDPNANSVTPISGFYIDLDALRLFMPNKADPNAAGIAWIPSNSKLFLQGEAANTTNYYENDFYGRRFGNNICLDVYDGGVWEDTTTGCPGTPGPSGGGSS